MEEFWNNFLPSFLSDSIGVFIGAFLGWLASSRLSNREQQLQRKNDEKAKAERSLHYLKLLKNEIQSLAPSLQPSIKALIETGWGRVFRIETLLWDIVRTSGELPGLIANPELLKSLTHYYGALAGARQAMGWIVESWLAPRQDVPGYNDKLNSFVSLTVEGLKDAQAKTGHLIELINQEVQRLEERVK
ncbi:MAG: hypothetical protein JXA89_05825 [Anaerolineae bacterium]|nr:hypothetical protein [Anaerolineae bacterium]